jgi:hypothetical protein
MPHRVPRARLTVTFRNEPTPAIGDAIALTKASMAAQARMPRWRGTEKDG